MHKYWNMTHIHTNRRQVHGCAAAPATVHAAETAEPSSAAFPPRAACEPKNSRSTPQSSLATPPPSCNCRRWHRRDEHRRDGCHSASAAGQHGLLVLTPVSPTFFRFFFQRGEGEGGGYMLAGRMLCCVVLFCRVEASSAVQNH